MKKIVTLVVLISSLFAACGDKNKKVNAKNPTITIQNHVEADSICGYWEDNVIKVAVPSVFKLSMVLKGDIALSQYKINVHENDPCHRHGQMPPNNGLDEKNYWQENRIVTLTDTEHAIEEIFTIDADKTLGNYHLTIKLIDANGNEAEEKELNIILTK
jgi:hypothetical protein